MLRILFLLCLTSALGAQQDFKIAAGGKTIEFSEIDQLTIVGSTGAEMVVEAKINERDKDERAEGLRKISASGLTDNTGFGLSVTERDGQILVQQVGGEGSEVTVRVPNSASITVEQTTHRGGDLTVSNFSGELDVSMMYHTVTLNNVTGPVAVNAVYEDIVATWDAAPTNEVRLHSTYSDVDVTLPANTKADLRLSTGYGNMYTDFDIQIKTNTIAGRPDTEREGDDRRGRRDRDDREGNPVSSVHGTINGGGTLMALTATYDNLYIRKK